MTEKSAGTPKADDIFFEMNEQTEQESGKMNKMVYGCIKENG